MDLRNYLSLALSVALGVSIAVTGLLVLNLWATTLVGITLAAVVLQLLGIMGTCNIKLNAVPAVLLVVSVGIAMHFTGHICLSFVTTIGNRDRRIRLALEHMWSSIVHGALAIFLAVIMFAFSEFEFIGRYFFLILISAIGVGIVNGLFFFPILLAVIGPAAEIIPNDYPDRIATPTPPQSPIKRGYKAPTAPKRSHRIENVKLHAEPSLTTITEEPNSWHSQQESCIIVQPEVKVETSTCGNQNCSANEAVGSTRISQIPQQSHITTKVTATVTTKVELHTPLPGGMDCTRHASSCNLGRTSCCSSNTGHESPTSSGSESSPD